MRSIPFAVLALVLLALPAHAACDTSGDPTLIAASASRADVNDCVTAATDCDTILIPNGTATWTTGISTSKQVWIRAQNYTPTSGGDTTRNVVLTNNSSEPMFTLTSGNTCHIALSGIRIDEGTSTENAVALEGTGTKVPLISDMYFEVDQRNGTSTTVSVLNASSLGAVIWNTRFQGIGTGGTGGVGPDGASWAVHSPRDWETASTMGTLDTDGSINVYLEDSSCENVGQFPDIDDNGRVVIRYTTYDGCSGLTHGFTSTWGGRHWEYYNVTFSVTEEERNHNGRYFWIRAGTGVFTDNVVNNSANPGAYGNVDAFSIGDNTSPGSYLMPRQPGAGHDGMDDVSDPIYSWNNSGARASAWGYQDDPGGWEAIVVEDRDVFIENGAKPGYSKYTYPHPLRSELGEGGGGGGGTVSSRISGRVSGRF